MAASASDATTKTQNSQLTSRTNSARSAATTHTIDAICRFLLDQRNAWPAYRRRVAGEEAGTQRCRHRGELRPEDRLATDRDQLARLFDESRDPAERVRDDDWHPFSDPVWRELDGVRHGGAAD